MSIAQIIADFGGLAPTHQLRRAGISKYRLRAEVSRGTLVRVRQGWYCLPTLAAHPLQGVRVGGRLTCVSGAGAHGLAVRDAPKLHVCVAQNSSRLRTRHDKTKRLKDSDAADVLVHWTGSSRPGTTFTLNPRECLRDMIGCQSPEFTIAAADSALRLGLITAEQWRSDIEALPARLRRLLAQVDDRSESITESIVRFRLRMLGVTTEPQLRVPGVGRVDLVIGMKLAIEVDGRAYHVSGERFELDRERDAKLSIRGYRVLRFSYRQVMYNWAQVRASILAAIARGDHL